MKIYCAHQITGLSYESVRDYYISLVEELAGLGYDVFFPLCGKGYLKGEHALKSSGYLQPLSTDLAILRRDHWMVEQADVVLADLTGTTSPSIGCVSEICFAYEMRKHTIIVMEKENCHRHAFINSMGDVIFETIDEAKNYLDILIHGSV